MLSDHKFGDSDEQELRKIDLSKQNPKKSFEAIRPEDSLNSLDQEVQNPKPKASIGNLDNSEEFFSTFNGAN
jgi:hypothetical protein